MRYLGGKQRLSKKIGKELLLLGKFDYYFEPFCGGCWVASSISKNFKQCFLSDVKQELIALWEAAIAGTNLPEELSEDRYTWLKEGNGEAWERGLAGFGCSFGGKYFGGYARGEGRNFCKEAKRSLLNKCEKLKGNVIFSVKDYRDLIFPDNSLIYCDPPYYGKTNYGIEFDTDAFWNWVRQQKQTIVISEYTAPSDIELLGEFDTVLSLRSKGLNKRVEKLFIWNNPNTKGKLD